MSDMHPLSGAYAVDALDELERARFERHLAECPDCAAEVKSLREAAGLLGLTADPMPPQMVRQRVMAEIHTVRPLPPTVSPVETARHRARRFPQLLAAAAAAVIVVGGGVGIAVTHPFRDDQPPAVAVPVSEQVMQATDSRNQSTELRAGGRATLFHSKSVGRSVLVTKGLAEAPEGKVYELWYLKDGQFVPAGLMASGGSQTFVLHGNIGDAKGVGITVEPTKGSKHPTSLPIASFDLAQSV